MNITVTYSDALHTDAPLLALGTWEHEPLDPAIADLLEASDWSSKYKRTQLLYPRGALAPRRLLLVGLGKRADFNIDRLCEIAAVTAQAVRSLHLDRYTFDIPGIEELGPFRAAQTAVEGIMLGLYRYQDYQTTLDADDRHDISDIVLNSRKQDPAVQQGATCGAAIARGTILARDLANGPGNAITPTKLAEVAQSIGERTGINITVLGLDELKQQGFGGLLAVAQGGPEPPRFIIMEYGTKQPGTPTICLVGKGITFDTGGISIKPADNMDFMKMDMGGAAAVLGTMQSLGELKLPLHVVGLISSTENMPSGTAYKPGDIIKTLSGKTIEVLNTDAEGRIVLADALYYAQHYTPDSIIDLATLTGAITVALGPHAIGVMGNNDALAARILRAGDACSERAWQLPLWDPYREMVKSDIADVKNSTGRQGGSITAAAFLEHFVGNYPWAHLDIAGTAWVERTTKAYAPKGATGVGVRLLIELLRTWENTQA